MLPPPDPRMQQTISHQADQVLKIESTTWNRDSHELFDYESRHVYNKHFLLRRGCRVFRQQLEVSVVPDGRDLPNGTDFLLSIRSREGRYFVYPADRASCLGGINIQHRKLWLIIKHLQDGRYPLVEGDIIKLGRFKLRVKQLVTEETTGQTVDFKLDDVEVPVSDLTNEDSRTQQCRICLLEGNNEEDPLVRACQCKGSIMYIHLGCLQHWVNSRLNLTDDPQRSCFFIRQLQCELCKSPFPSSVVHRSVRYNVVKIPNVAPPFIVLENQVGATNKGVHLCSMAVKKDCKLGRGHESDVRIADVSISRFHAMIRFDRGTFYLEDHTSKFGTLVALRRPIQVENDMLAVQVGRTVLQLNLTDMPTNALLDEVVEIPQISDQAENQAEGQGTEGLQPGPQATANTPTASGPPAQQPPAQQNQLQNQAAAAPQFDGGEEEDHNYGSDFNTDGTRIRHPLTPGSPLQVMAALLAARGAVDNVARPQPPRSIPVSQATINGEAISASESQLYSANTISQPQLSNLTQALELLRLEPLRREQAMGKD